MYYDNSQENKVLTSIYQFLFLITLTTAATLTIISELHKKNDFQIYLHYRLAPNVYSLKISINLLFFSNVFINKIYYRYISLNRYRDVKKIKTFKNLLENSKRFNNYILF